jgi:hypothetical protein
LPYELDMFEEAAKFLMSEEFAKLDRENDWFRANAAIEAFWTHARTLQEFFNQPKNREPMLGAHHASARDFAFDYWPDLDLQTVVDKINNEVSHLNYGRESLPPEKLGHEMQYVKAAIDKQVRRFQETLAAAAGKKKHADQVWEVRPPRQPVEFIRVSGDPSSTSIFTTVSFTSFPARGMTKGKPS